MLYLDGRRDFPTTEVFGRPRRDHQQHPGTSSGSHPSGPRFTDLRYRLPSSEDEEEVQREDRDEESGRGPPEIGEWERQQEGEREKGKGQSKSTRRVVRREDVEEEEKEGRKWTASDVELEEEFEEVNDMKPGTVSRIREQFSNAGMSNSEEFDHLEFYKLLGETLMERDEALEASDSKMKKEKKDLLKKEKRKKKKKARKARSSDNQDNEEGVEDKEEMEEEEEK